MFALSTLCHGATHEYIAYDSRRFGRFLDDSSDDTPPLYQVLSFGFVFWYPFLSVVLPRLKSIPILLLASQAAALGSHFVPSRFSFTYVQTILGVAAAISNLSNPKRDHMDYVAEAWWGLPVAILPYFEAMACHDRLYQRLGGHAIFDFYLAGGLVVVYVLKHYQVQRNRVEKKVD